jgi:electron transfer flavoprotein beta subunit
VKIAILLKQVPVKDATLKVSGDGLWIDEENVAFEINESDHFGLEEALRLKEKHGGEVVVVSMGPERVKESIKQALAKGADRAIHINSSGYTNPDPMAHAKILCAAIKEENFDLILSGLQSDDFGYGLTGVLVAEMLGLPHATLVMETGVQDGKIKVKRELESGWFQNIEFPLPAVLTIQSGLNQIRYATIKGIMAAKRKEIKELSFADLGLSDLDTQASGIDLHKIYVPQKTKETVVLEGDTKDIVATLIDKLKNEAKIL